MLILKKATRISHSEQSVVICSSTIADPANSLPRRERLSWRCERQRYTREMGGKLSGERDGRTIQNNLVAARAHRLAHRSMQ